MSCINCNCYSCEIVRTEQSKEMKVVYKPCMFCGVPVPKEVDGQPRTTICTGCNVTKPKSIPC